jgi:excisionase family DNA binding protein
MGQVIVQRQAWSAPEIAARLGISISFVRKEILSGRLRCTRLGRRVLILDEHLREYLHNGSRPREAQVSAN